MLFQIFTPLCEAEGEATRPHTRSRTSSQDFCGERGAKMLLQIPVCATGCNEVLSLGRV